MGICLPLLAELWAVFVGLHLARERGYANVILEKDSLSSVEHLLSDNNISSNSNFVILEKYKKFLIKDWTIEASRIYSKATTLQMVSSIGL